MKKAIFVLAVLLVALPLAAQEAPTQVNASLSVQFPGFAFGPMVDFVTYPISIKIDEGMHNYLGWGGAAGLMVAISPAFGVAIPIEGIFVGRFGFIKDIPIDFDARVGLMLGQFTMFYGSTNLAVQFPLSSFTARASAGIDFFPAGMYFGVGFDLQFGLVFPLQGFKSILSIGG